MSDDDALRAVFIAIVLVVLPVGIYHRVKSQATGESLDRRQEGWFILATLRPIGAVLAVSLGIYLFDRESMAWSSMALPLWLRWTGVALCALGGTLLLWSFQRLGKNLTDTVVTRKAHTLVVAGPYHWVRHPFYDAVALFLLGLSLFAANWFLSITSVVILALLVIRTPTEEAKLLARFGDDYRAYVARTGRFVPRFSVRSGEPQGSMRGR
jgi:protein-S-isoprenylcysteine O-methyltransferase Ste14